MKSLATIFLLLTSYFLLRTFYFSPAFAQEEQLFDFTRAYQDYAFTYNQYRTAHAEYVTARQAYLTYKTLTSKNEAFQKTLAMLKLRDEALHTYLTAIRKKMAETTGISSYELNILYLKLDEEINWFSDHRDQLASTGTLEDLVDLSEQAQKRYQQTELLVYQSLLAILSGKEISLREAIGQQIESLKEKLLEVKLRGDKKTDLLDRWLLEAESSLTRSQEKQATAQETLAKAKPQDRNKTRTYNEAQFSLEESHQYLKQANSYLKEFLREVKSAD